LSLKFFFAFAILFADILLIPNALGQHLEFIEGKGPSLKPIKSFSDYKNLNEVNKIHDILNPVYDAVSNIKSKLEKNITFIGFAGSPWTLASYIIEGGSSKDNLKSRAIANENPKLLDSFLERITDTTIEYLNDQINAGADVIQIFDSQGGTLSSYNYWNISGKWIKKIIDSLGKRVPFIVFARGVHHNWDELTYTGANALSIDWNINIKKTADFLPENVAVQGNLDPAVLTTNPDAAIAATKLILEDMKNRNGFIFNLGHGVTPNAKIETIQAVTNTVQNYL